MLTRWFNGRVDKLLDQELISYRYSCCFCSCFCSCCWVERLDKAIWLRRFKSDRHEIWQECPSRKCASINQVGFSIWRHIFKMAANGHDVISRRKVPPPGE